MKLSCSEDDEKASSRRKNGRCPKPAEKRTKITFHYEGTVRPTRLWKFHATRHSPFSAAAPFNAHVPGQRVKSALQRLTFALFRCVREISSPTSDRWDSNSRRASNRAILASNLGKYLVSCSVRSRFDGYLLQQFIFLTCITLIFVLWTFEIIFRIFAAFKDILGDVLEFLKIFFEIF